MTDRRISTMMAGFVLAVGASLWLHAQAPARDADMNQIPIDADDIAGVVTSARGPEAGVWVIAETTDTPTKFRKIVVTDDQGRYLLPDLPGPSRHVPDLGARLRPGRLDAGPRDARAASGVGGRPGGRSPARRADLPGELLVLTDQHPAGEGLSGHGSVRQRHQSGHDDAASLD